MMAGAFSVVVAGHICLDVFPDLSTIAGREMATLLQPGQLVVVGPVTFSAGGPVSNTGVALHKLGIRTRLMGKLGDDLLGQIVRNVVDSQGAGLADGMVVDPAVNTSYTIILSPPGTDRTFLHCPGANDSFGAGDVRYKDVARARLFHFGYPPLMKQIYEDDGAQLVEILRRVKELGVTTSLDMTVPDPASAAGRADWMTIIETVMPYVDVFLPSVGETLYMLRRDVYDDLARVAGVGGLVPLVTPALLSDLGGELVGMGAGVVGLKLGSRGLYVRTGDEAALLGFGASRPLNPVAWAGRELWAPCFEVDVVGTTGAGDATVAGFLSALLRGMSLEQAATGAVAVGACNVEAADALRGIRSWEETWRRVQSGWERHELVLDAPGWEFDEQHGLWRGPARSTCST